MTCIGTCVFSDFSRRPTVGAFWIYQIRDRKITTKNIHNTWPDPRGFKSPVQLLSKRRISCGWLYIPKSLYLLSKLCFRATPLRVLAQIQRTRDYPSFRFSVVCRASEKRKKEILFISSAQMVFTRTPRDLHEQDFQSGSFPS